MFRGVVGIVLGYLLFAASAVILFAATGRDPHAPQDLLFVVLSTFYGCAFAVLAGFLAALIASGRELHHAAAVGVIIAIGALISIAAVPAGVLPWSQLAALLLMAPATVLGGLVERARKAGRRLRGISAGGE